MNIDDYEKRTNDQGYWQNSEKFLYDNLEDFWRKEAYPGLEHPAWLYETKNILLSLVSQNKFDWTHYMAVPRFNLARIDSLHKGFLDASILWIKKLKAGSTNLTFVGENGCGKTYSAIAAARFMSLHGILRSGNDDLYMPTSRMIECNNAHNLLDNWSKTQDVARELDIYKNVPLLIIDDLGAVSTSAQASIANLLTIISTRYNLNLPTIVTSNKTVDNLVEVFGSTSVRRLFTNETVIYIP